ncbi:hypothetical protein JX266_007793 [Neoarthrinium moseri]|nr:hypothetical protein JX266_007793 [Neoarthrinium moseri]
MWSGGHTLDNLSPPFPLYTVLITVYSSAVSCVLGKLDIAPSPRVSAISSQTTDAQAQGSAGPFALLLHSAGFPRSLGNPPPPPPRALTLAKRRPLLPPNAQRWADRLDDPFLELKRGRPACASYCFLLRCIAWSPAAGSIEREKKRDPGRMAPRSREHSSDRDASTRAAQPTGPYEALDSPNGDDKKQQGYALDVMSSSRRNGNGAGAGYDDDVDGIKKAKGDDDLKRQDTANALGVDGDDDDGTVEGGSIIERHGAGAPYRVYKRRWFGLVALTLMNVIVSWDWLTFSPVSQHAAAYYGESESTINWLSTGFLFVFVVISPLTVYMLHWGVKPSIVTAAALLLVGNWVRYAGSHDSAGGTFGVVMFGQVLIGAAQSFVLSGPTRYSDLWFTSRGRVGTTALMSLANPLGAALGQLVVPFMVTQPSDVSSMVLYVSVIATVICIPSFFVPAAPPTPPAPSCETPKEPLLASVRRLGRNLEFWLILLPYGIYVGLFNSISSLLNQMMMPYGFSSDDAGIAGAVLIVVGLVAAAITSPILDRTKAFLLAIKTAIPLIGLCYLAFVWMPATRVMAGPYVVLAVLGAASFSLVPVALEYLIELSHPCSPEVTSTAAWSLGQLLGATFILISDALKAPADADPPANLDRALVFQAVIALAVVPLPLCLGLFGRADRVKLRRVESDNRVLQRASEA